MLHQLATEGAGTHFWTRNLMWGSNRDRGMTGGYFQKLFTPKCRVRRATLASRFFFFFSTSHHWTRLIEWQRARMMKVTPDPSAFKTKVNCDQESHLRSPLSAVSDSFGHENEVDISKSSEEKTSATGSNVAPRRMGSLFSPMEKNNNKKRGSPLLHRGWELSTQGEQKKEKKKKRRRPVCADHLE